jgi:hypothetical protein
MAIDMEDGTFDPNMKFVQMEDCKDICGSLVEMSAEGFVVLVHSTAKGCVVPVVPSSPLLT